MALFYDVFSKYIIALGLRFSKQCLPFNAYKAVRYSVISAYYSKKISDNGFVIKKQRNGITVSGKNIKVFGLNTNIIKNINDIIINDCYHFDKGHNTQWSVLDIGMNVGVASLYFAQNPNIAKVYSYEPFAPIYNIGMQNLELNPALAQKIIPHNYGLSNREDIIDLPYDIEMSTCCSTIPEKQNKLFGTNKRTAKERIYVHSAARELKRILETDKNNIMLKIDCEGSEREIIIDLYENKLLSSVQAISMEYHDGIYRPLIEMMENSGFSVSHTEDTMNNTVGMIYAYNIKHR